MSKQKIYLDKKEQMYGPKPFTGRLIVAYMIENDEDVFELSYNSIKDVADGVVVINGNHKKMSMYSKPDGINMTEIFHPYPHEDKGADGKQRNKYLKHVKEHYKGDWCLVLDADEVIANPENIKPTIEQLEANGFDCANVRMRHCVGNLGQEDATLEKHYVPARLFKIQDDLSYPEVEHNVLQGWKKCANIDSFVNWHLGYSREVFRLNKKWRNHKTKSNIHNAQFLDWWYHSHLLGEFPTSKVNWHELPDVIKEHFDINEDYLYFKDRGFELKHAECVKQWNKYFKPTTVLDIGCGRGPYLRFWEDYTLSEGLELSQWAINNKICECEINQGDIKDYESIPNYYDLVTVLDILEHLEEEDLQKALKNIHFLGEKNFLFSIPFEGDPNLYGDHTHKIFKSKEWWLAELKKAGFKVEVTPENFYFKEQMVVCTKC